MNNAQFVRWFNYLYTLVYNNLLNNQRVHHIMVCPIISTCIPIVCIYIYMYKRYMSILYTSVYVYIYIYTWIFHSWLSEKSATVEEICIYIYIIILHLYIYIYIPPRNPYLLPNSTVLFTVPECWKALAGRTDHPTAQARGEFSVTFHLATKIVIEKYQVNVYLYLTGFCYGIILQ